MRNTLVVILALNAVVLAVKVVVGVRTGALSVLGAALESGLDMLNNFLGIIIVAVAAKAPDETHPYGHEKFETLGALAIVGLLSISCFELLREGVDHLLRRHVPRAPSAVELALLGATMVVNFFVVSYERRRGRQLNSAFLLADSAHTYSDIFVTAAALASLIFARFGLGVVDPILAIIVAFVIARNGYEIVKGTVPVLVDERGADADEIRGLVEGIPEVVDVRAVRSRTSASGVVFVEVTIGVRATTPVSEAHRIADTVEERIGAQLGPSEVIVHVEPA